MKFAVHACEDGKLKEELESARDELKGAKEATISKYNKSDPFIEDLSSKNVEAMKIGFIYLYDRLACDFPYANLS